MGDDTRMGGAERAFPVTRHSIVQELGSEETGRRQLAFDALVAAYWKPVYSYLRLRHGVDSETAKDWTQGFFTFALQRGNLERFDAARARFRTWLRVCLDRWLANVLESERRLKRGGHIAHLSFDQAELELSDSPPQTAAEVEAAFEREWMRGLFESALEDLRSDSGDLEFEIFHRYDVVAPEAGERLRYRDLADELGLPTTKITNTLHGMRGRFRSKLLARLRMICASDDEFREEARRLLGRSA